PVFSSSNAGTSVSRSSGTAISPSRAAGSASAFARPDSPSVRAVRRSSRTPMTTRTTTPAMIASAIGGAWGFTLSTGAGLRIDVPLERGVDHDTESHAVGRAGDETRDEQRLLHGRKYTWYDARRT